MRFAHSDAGTRVIEQVFMYARHAVSAFRARSRTVGYLLLLFFFLFFFNDTATTVFYTLSLHDALPIFFFSFVLKPLPFFLF